MEHCGQLMAMSNSQLYRKTVALTGLTLPTPLSADQVEAWLIAGAILYGGVSLVNFLSGRAFHLISSNLEAPFNGKSALLCSRSVILIKSDKASESLSVAKEKLAEAQVLAKQKGLIAAAATDRYVHESPWVAVGVAAGLGLVVGALLNRR